MKTKNLGLIDLTTSQGKEQAVYTARRAYKINFFKKLRLDSMIWIFLIGGTYYYWYNWRDPSVYHILIIITLMVITYQLITLYQLRDEFQELERKLQAENQFEQAKNYIFFGQKIGVKSLTLKTNDKKVLDLYTDIQGVKFKPQKIDENLFEIEIKYE